MSDVFIQQFTGGLTEEEMKASEAMYQNYKDNTALSDEQILEHVFHGDASKVRERMKEVDDFHVKMTAGGGFKVSRYSEECLEEENRNFNELKKQNEELKRQNEELRSDFNDLKNLIIEKLK